MSEATQVIAGTVEMVKPDSATTHCEYNVSYGDFAESMKGYRKVSKGAAFAYYLDVWLVPLIGFLLVLYFLSAYLRGDRETVSEMAYLPIVGLLGIVAPSLFYRFKLRQAYRQRISLTPEGHVALDFDNESVRFTIAHKAEVTYSWESFTDYIETDRVATLFIKKAAFHTIPKRAMTDEGWAALRELALQHVGTARC